jgi:alpha-D-xyloside xylohydrolase
LLDFSSNVTMKFGQSIFASFLITFSSAHAVHVPRLVSSPSIKHEINSILDSSQVLVGNANTTVAPATNSSTTKITTKLISPLGGPPTTIRVDINSKFDFVGVRFQGDKDQSFFGVWEYPWNNNLGDNGFEFDFKGLGVSTGVNWDNARAPFFFSSSGYGVYADTLSMGSFDFKTPGQAEFIFNTSSLTYYIILPGKEGDFKSIVSQYVAGLSETITMPPDSGYGPTFWSDDFTQDFHGSVSNAQENFFDVVNHLFDLKIHATSMFADRPYGTGNMSFGNFDFDPKFYPDPVEFIANLLKSGYDLQVGFTPPKHCRAILRT